MLAEQLIKEGDLPAALKSLQEFVRKDPSNAKYRVFLFQLLAVQGNWARALTQLGVSAELDAATLPMVQTYREALQCEALRKQIFEGKRPPLIFGQPQSWTVMLLEALRLDGAGQYAQADQLRAQALEQAPATSGVANDKPFAWLADADTRMGPVLEAIVNGRYYWIPFNCIAEIEFEAPVDLRDKVWTPAVFTWVNGGQSPGLIPSRYEGTESSEDSALLLGRRTEWRTVAGSETPRGIGQRMLITDEDDYALLDLRKITLDSVALDEGEEAQDDGAEAPQHG
ncbi:type VI secretion system accessory protein TagJ [Massilia sp. W12]|uniref:type VI secretion system accessory protein TagJ n=1 Tax=Massilia sp. W12 TaxID=3126507 RepID=UPI0030D0A979